MSFFRYDPYSVPDLQGRDETRRLFGIPEDATVYTCFHSVYKLHPDFDAVIAGILKRSDANTRIVFLAARRHQHMEIVRGAAQLGGCGGVGRLLMHDVVCRCWSGGVARCLLALWIASWSCRVSLALTPS